MTVEENKQVVERIFAALNDRDLETVTSYYHPDCRFYGWAPQMLDVAGYKETMGALLAAFPDSRFPVADVIAEDDTVAVRHNFQGTHQEPFQGVPASGRQVDIGGIAIFRLEDGKAAELWLNADFLGLLQQIGAIPTPS
jgi:steroid delta-isomerase-like uncharacterized protein